MSPRFLLPATRPRPRFPVSYLKRWHRTRIATWVLPLLLVGAAQAAPPVPPTAAPGASGAVAAPGTPQIVGALWQGRLGATTSVALTVFRESADDIPISAETSSDPRGERRERVVGTVRYGPMPATARLLLEGGAPHAGRIDWRVLETGVDDQARPFRREVARLAGYLERDGRAIVATWAGADGTRPLPLTLRQVAQYREQVVERDHARLTERYPVTGDGAIDTLIQSMRIAACRTGMVECRNGIEIAWLDRERVSLLRTFWFFSGGAHGNLTYAGGNWRKTPQGYQPVALADILALTPACRDTLNQRLVDVLRRQGATQAAAGALDDKAWSNASLPFVWHGKGLVVYYAPYAVGPYVQGSFRAPVGFAQLGACVRAEPARDKQEKE